jgi:hypothetical protein
VAGSASCFRRCCEQKLARGPVRFEARVLNHRNLNIATIAIAA